MSNARVAWTKPSRVPLRCTVAFAAIFILGLPGLGQTDRVQLTRAADWQPSLRGYACAIAVAGNCAYVAGNLEDETGGILELVDITTPTDPWVGGAVGGYDLLRRAYGVAVSGPYACIVGGAGGLVVVDITDPMGPRQLGRWNQGHYAYGLAMSGTCAYLADAEGGLRVIDLVDPAQPQQVGQCQFGGEAWGVALSGTYAHVAGPGLQIIDVTEPANPQRVGGVNLASAAGVAVSGNYAYVAAGSSGLQALTITELPAFTRQSVLNANVGFSWNEAARGMTLQRTPSLTAPDWQIVAGAGMTNYVALPLSGASAFFRLVKP